MLESRKLTNETLYFVLSQANFLTWQGIVAGKWNPAEAGHCLAQPTSLPLRCHTSKEVKRLRKTEGQLCREGLWDHQGSFWATVLFPWGGTTGTWRIQKQNGQASWCTSATEDPDHQQKLPLGPRVVISSLTSPFVFLCFSIFDLIYRHIRVVSL